MSAHFLFVYHGGEHPESDEAADAEIQAWMKWLGDLGEAVIDAGNPVGQSCTVMPDGSVLDHGGPNPVNGYGIFKAESIEAAQNIAKGCPALASGGSVEIAQIFDVG